jgi:hypothetical protein
MTLVVESLLILVALAIWTVIGLFMIATFRQTRPS